jgi:cytochrome c553
MRFPARHRRLRSVAAAVALVLALLPAGRLRAAPLQDQIAQCAACHDEKAPAQTPPVPLIAGQPKLFLMYQLFFFREGRRKNLEMNTIAKGMSDADLDALSDVFSKQPAAGPKSDAVDEVQYLRGAALARQRQCASCHNPDFSGREQMARLAGQRETYLLRALEDYQSGARIGTQAAMAETVRGLTQSELADLAYYLARFR